MEQSRGAGDAKRSIEAVWRVESARVIAALGRISGDLGAAEDLAHDALLAALQQWPVSGLPASPFSWLVTVGRRRFIDGLRRSARAGARNPRLLRQAEQAESASGHQLEAAAMEPGGDLLRLMFACCHPVLSDEARVALTLKLLGGLSTEQIARATLEHEATVAQRIVRAKRTLRATEVRLDLPPPSELRARVESVLAVIYLIFNEGYVATSGGAWTEPTLCREALRLGRVLAELVRDVEEVHGLVALMELQASRLRARTGPNGEAVLLADQERSRWDRLLIRRGLARWSGRRASAGASARTASRRRSPPAMRRPLRSKPRTGAGSPRCTTALGEIAPSPVVELNRAVAVTMAYGPQAGLAVLDAIAGHPQLANYHLALSVRGDLLERLGRFTDAESAFAAAAMTANEQEQLLLSRRADQAGAPRLWDRIRHLSASCLSNLGRWPRSTKWRGNSRRRTPALAGSRRRAATGPRPFRWRPTRWGSGARPGLGSAPHGQFALGSVLRQRRRRARTRGRPPRSVRACRGNPRARCGAGGSGRGRQGRPVHPRVGARPPPRRPSRGQRRG